MTLLDDESGDILNLRKGGPYIRIGGVRRMGVGVRNGVKFIDPNSVRRRRWTA